MHVKYRNTLLARVNCPSTLQGYKVIVSNGCWMHIRSNGPCTLSCKLQYFMYMTYKWSKWQWTIIKVSGIIVNIIIIKGWMKNFLLKQVMFVQNMTTTGGPSTKWAFLWFWPHNTRRPSTPQQYQATPSLIFFFRLAARLNYGPAGSNKKWGKLTKLLIIWVNTNWGLDNAAMKGRKCNNIHWFTQFSQHKVLERQQSCLYKIHVWNFVHV